MFFARKRLVSKLVKIHGLTWWRVDILYLNLNFKKKEDQKEKILRFGLIVIFTYACYNRLIAHNNNCAFPL